jgi:hypothetical protein
LERRGASRDIPAAATWARIMVHGALALARKKVDLCGARLAWMPKRLQPAVSVVVLMWKSLNSVRRFRKIIFLWL